MLMLSLLFKQCAGKSSEGPPGDPFLLACRFFDKECAGYLDADDLEEIAFMVSDGISREFTSCAVHWLVAAVTLLFAHRVLPLSSTRWPVLAFAKGQNLFMGQLLT